MKTIDQDGLLLCDLQAEAFEMSVNATASSSAVFIRRFMNSKIAKWLDGGSILALNVQPADLLKLVEEQYGPSGYGSLKYTQNEMYWIGYVYRYYSYTYQCSSVHAYKIIKPDELRGLFLPYHTLDPAQAIERILEAKGISGNMGMDMKHQYEIFRKIRENRKKES